MDIYVDHSTIPYLSRNMKATRIHVQCETCMNMSYKKQMDHPCLLTTSATNAQGHVSYNCMIDNWIRLANVRPGIPCRIRPFQAI